MNEQNNKCDYEDDFIFDLHNYEYKKMLEKADNVVLGFVAATGVTGAVPIPFSDAPLLVAEQVTMMLSINAIFKINVSKDALKSLVTAVLGVGGATFIGKTIVANVLKLIPAQGLLQVVQYLLLQQDLLLSLLARHILRYAKQ